MQMKITNNGYKTKETNYRKLTPNTNKYARINEQILAPTIIAEYTQNDIVIKLIQKPKGIKFLLLEKCKVTILLLKTPRGLKTFQTANLPK